MTSSWQRPASGNWDCYTGKDSLLVRGTVTLAKTHQWQGELSHWQRVTTGKGGCPLAKTHHWYEELSHWQRLTTGMRNCHTGKDSPLV